MKKFFVLCFVFMFCFCLSGCKGESNLSEHLTQVRSDYFVSEDENYQIKAVYGFNTDKNSGKKIYTLSFKLLNFNDEQVTHTLSFDYNQKNYSGQFKFNPVKNCMMLDVEVPNFNLKDFDVDFMGGSSVNKVKLRSVVPENAINYQSALKLLLEKQPELINLYKNGENLNLKISMRIAVKENNAYWFVSLSGDNNSNKILLIDAINKEILAVRDVF